MQARPIALVSGASRGMGAATAVALAVAGYDVAIAARSLNATTRPTEPYISSWPRTLDSTLEDVADRVRAAGGVALPVQMDLTDRGSVQAGAAAVLDRFGRCDVLCNIGVYQGPGSAELFLDTPIVGFANHLEADVLAPAILCQAFLPGMVERRRGIVVNMSSHVVANDPPGTVLDNGWSLAYAAAKAGIDRFASVLNAELIDTGVVTYTVEPGFVAYGTALDQALARFPDVPVSPPEAIGAAIVWLVTSPDASRLKSKRIHLPAITHRYGLLPGWGGPGSRYRAAASDRAEGADQPFEPTGP
jgi:NAD(P)-dependent dehydrogenase (short-subunit alcohol dehydrogenase family)